MVTSSEKYDLGKSVTSVKKVAVEKVGCHLGEKKVDDVKMQFNYFG